MSATAVQTILKKNPIQYLDARLQSGEDFPLRLALQYCDDKDFINIFEYYCDTDFDNIVLPFLESLFTSNLATVSEKFKKALEMLVDKDTKKLQKLIILIIKSSARNKFHTGNFQEMNPSPAEDAALAAAAAAMHAQLEVDAAVAAGTAPPNPPLLVPPATKTAQSFNVETNLRGTVEVLYQNSIDRTELEKENLLTFAIRVCPYEHVLLLERLALNWLSPNKKIDNALLAALDRSANTKFQKLKDKEDTTTLISWYSPSGERGANAVGVKPICDDPDSVSESFNRLEKSPMYSNKERIIIGKWLKLRTSPQTGPDALPNPYIP